MEFSLLVNQFRFPAFSIFLFFIFHFTFIARKCFHYRLGITFSFSAFKKAFAHSWKLTFLSAILCLLFYHLIFLYIFLKEKPENSQAVSFSLCILSSNFFSVFFYQTLYCLFPCAIFTFLPPPLVILCFYFYLHLKNIAQKCLQVWSLLLFLHSHWTPHSFFQFRFPSFSTCLFLTLFFLYSEKIFPCIVFIFSFIFISLFSVFPGLSFSLPFDNGKQISDNRRPRNVVCRDGEDC